MAEMSLNTGEPSVESLVGVVSSGQLVFPLGTRNVITEGMLIYARMLEHDLPSSLGAHSVRGLVFVSQPSALHAGGLIGIKVLTGDLLQHGGDHLARVRKFGCLRLDKSILYLGGMRCGGWAPKS
jgi:hypothetical protein